MENNLIEQIINLSDKCEQQKEKLAIADNAFTSILDAYLLLRPEMKKKYDDKINGKIDKIHKKHEAKIKSIIINDALEKEATETIVEEHINKEKVKENIFDIVKEKKKENSDIKKLYRDIVKLTHPDKISKNNYNGSQLKILSEYYDRSVKAYDTKELIPLIKIGTKLHLKINLSLESLDELVHNITSISDEIANIETTFVWCWYNAPTKVVQDKMLEMFLLKFVS